MTRKNVMDIAGNQLNETNPFLLPDVIVKRPPVTYFRSPGAGDHVERHWVDLKGNLIDERGTIK